MLQQSIDVSKLVGAASAPVALIIATSIFLSNLTARYTAMFTAARRLTEEYRGKEEHDARAESLRRQIGVYRYRLHLLIRATFWLTLTIITFIGTVFFTSVSVARPGAPVWAVITGVTMFAGLVMLAWCVSIELWENRMARQALGTEMSEFPEVAHLEEPGQGSGADNSESEGRARDGKLPVASR